MRRAELLLLFAVACGRREPVEPFFQVVGETTKVRRGEAPPRTSPFFDGTTVRLRAARGETLGLQVVLYRMGETKVSLLMDGLTVVPHEVGYLEVTEPSSALYGPSAGKGAYPDILTPVRGPSVKSADAVYFDLEIPPGTPPGRRTGSLMVGGRRVPVELAVEAAEIEVERAPLVWVWYKASELAGAHRLADGDTPEQIALERRYADLVRRHGALLATDFPLERLRPRLDFLTDDVRFWPVWIAKRDPAQLARDVAGWIELFRGRPQVPFGFTIDEPDEAERAQVRAHGLAARAAGAGDGRFLYAVTDEPRDVYKGAVDVFVSPRGIPPPAGYGPGVHFWTYNGRVPAAGNMTIDKPGTALRTWGWIAERYQIELWFAWEGLYYTDRYNRATAPTDTVHQPITYDERRKGGEELGNGDGLLVYPGPLPSLRLKALRRGLTDRLLLRRLAGCPGGDSDAALLARTIVPRALREAEGGTQSWPDDEASFETARQQVLDAIARRCGAPP
ncbi:MAG TPA: glycoside hydrolase domain-containing protein [Kofleriaceae bacterium]|nr:glycoside hydrolase domain-containing protein [Kofleriaceae bacterium]